MNYSKDKEACSAAGFTVVELLIVMVIVAIISTLALSSFRSSSRRLNLAGATRNLSAYLEKARTDSVRRHALPLPANITINKTSSYVAWLDSTGNGTLTASTISFPAGTSLGYSLPPATGNIDPSATPLIITYDWRGRTETTVLLTLTDSTGLASSAVVVGRAGNLSTDTDITGPVTTPTPQNTTVTTTTGIKSMQY